MGTINKRLIPIKAHYFFFMAAMGPVLPQINVFGKQLGIGPDIMGFVMSVLPIMYILAKPTVGYLIDYFTHLRKVIFMIIVLFTAICYSGFYFVPKADSAETIYKTATFWIFVLLMSLGTIGFNVGNCVSDAICFDMLGENQEMKYGQQRVWGTIGFGATALLAGIAVNLSSDGVEKSIGPAIIVMLFFTSLDLFSMTKLKLPKMGGSESIIKEVKNLLKHRDIAIFLVFATIAGIIDSFVIYYMFWHLEELASGTEYEASIKLIEGCVIAAECLGGEILFFLISGKIIKKMGYVHCLSMCFFNYAVRLFLISIITNPWYLVPIEFAMQGATYALCYTSIVAYASAIAPPGTTATVQGLVAGMDDGVGFAIGSLIGGLMYKEFGGAMSFRVFGTLAAVACCAHIVLRPNIKEIKKVGTIASTTKDHIKYQEPFEQKNVESV